MIPTFRSLPLAALSVFLVAAFASESDHKYQAEELVKLWVNKVGPYNNPQETYNYYHLPFCQPSENPIHKWSGLGEVLGGNELIDSQIELKYQKNVDKAAICTIELDAVKVKQFKDAIDNSYWFEFFIDDLPLWGFVGETDKNNENKHYLLTHKNIVVQYNGEQIIHVNLTQESPKLLEAGKTLDMTYSVKWMPTDITFARRFDVYLDYPFFEHQIHWFSIFNSFMMVIFLIGLVSMILMRTLRNDYAKYAREDDNLETLERDVSEESGWKLVHGDVFRPPRNLVLLSAVVGTGAQLALLVLLVILLAIIGMLYIGGRWTGMGSHCVHNETSTIYNFGCIRKRMEDMRTLVDEEQVLLEVTQTMQIPLRYAEDIIGSGGGNIEFIRARSGANILILEGGRFDEIVVEIRGTPTQVQTAQQLIEDSIAGHKEPATVGYGSLLDRRSGPAFSQLTNTSYPSSLSTQTYDGYGSSARSEAAFSQSANTAYPSSSAPMQTYGGYGSSGLGGYDSYKY